MVKALRWVDGGAVSEAVERIHGGGVVAMDKRTERADAKADGTERLGTAPRFRPVDHRSHSWPARWALASPPLSRASCSFRSTRRVLLSVVSLVRLSASEIRASVNAPRRVLVAALRLAASFPTSLGALRKSLGRSEFRRGSTLRWRPSRWPISLKIGPVGPGE